MHNEQLLAGLLILVVAISYSAALFLYLKGRLGLALGLVVFSGFALRFFCALDPMLHKWDERFHALVAKNMIERPLEPRLYKTHVVEYDYKDWTNGSVQQTVSGSEAWRYPGARLVRRKASLQV